MDGKVFKLADFEPGITANPFHPYCRTTTCPFFDDEFDLSQRAARGKDRKIYNIDSNIKFPEWEEKLVS